MAKKVREIADKMKNRRMTGAPVPGGPLGKGMASLLFGGAVVAFGAYQSL